jgi:serine/threonine protein kinase
VLPVYDCFVDDDGTPAYASQRLRGRDWRALMPRLGRRGNLVVLSRCCEALAYAHDRGIIHRDLKPGNVMVGQHGEAVLIAWGAAAGLADERPLSALIPKPQAGQVVGTPAYMPPEVARSEAHRQDERTDVYGLGAILFELLVGEPPHPGDSVDEVQAGAAENRIAERRLGHPLFELALLAMATDPEQRPVSVLAFRHELDRRR